MLQSLAEDLVNQTALGRNVAGRCRALAATLFSAETIARQITAGFRQAAKTAVASQSIPLGGR
jgi:hypothetical protein